MAHSDAARAFTNKHHFSPHNNTMLAGVCGDPFQHYPNNTYYATMTNLPNQATYRAGANVTFTWDLTVNHGGRIGFKICARRTNLTQSCFDRNPLFRCVRRMSEEGGQTM
jgi:Lytic polysaccharide mono-oxygenase, cellulose-degrading